MSSLSINDLGRAQKLLGMRVNYDDKEGYELDHETTINDTLLAFGMDKAHGVWTLISDELNEAPDSEAELLPISGPMKTDTAPGSSLSSAVFCGLQGVLDRTLPSQCTRRRTVRAVRACMIGNSPSESLDIWQAPVGCACVCEDREKLVKSYM